MKHSSFSISSAPSQGNSQRAATVPVCMCKFDTAVPEDIQFAHPLPSPLHLSILQALHLLKAVPQAKWRTLVGVAVSTLNVIALLL